MKKLKVKGQNKIHHENVIPNKAGIAVLILEKIEFKPKENKKKIRDRVI